MKAKAFLLMALLLSFFPAASQKIVRKTIALPLTNMLRIDARQCSRVELETRAVETLEVEATIDGEYSSEILLQFGKEGSTTTVEAGVQPLFKLPNDKLSAHKVVAISLKVILPEHRRVQLYGSRATFTARGTYERLHLILEEGGCSLLNITGQAEVSTRTADVYVESPGATILAESRYGSISPNRIPSGDTYYKLRTISGNIRLIRME
jgi:hypothetical protein